VVATSEVGSLPQLSTARITAPSASGVVELDGGNGAAVQSRTLPAAASSSSSAATSTAFPLGAGYLVGTAKGTTAYR
jgi:hypothetical protein